MPTHAHAHAHTHTHIYILHRTAVAGTCTTYYSPDSTSADGVNGPGHSLVGTDAELQALAFRKFATDSVKRSLSFMAVLWFLTPHEPYETLPEFRQLYEAPDGGEGGKSGGGGGGGGGGSSGENQYTQEEMDYFGDVSAMDAGPVCLTQLCHLPPPCRESPSRSLLDYVASPWKEDETKQSLPPVTSRCGNLLLSALCSLLSASADARSSADVIANQSGDDQSNVERSWRRRKHNCNLLWWRQRAGAWCVVVYQ